MPPKRTEWLQRIKAIEREHTVTRLAVRRLLESANRDPTILKGDVTLRDIGHAAGRLEGTYLIRLFAEFETGLRLFWPTAKGTEPPGRTRDLLDGIASARRIPPDQLTNAHAVREYRNSLVHEREEETAPIPIAQARGHLCTFFSFLPLNW
jgi:hypothetical protein